MKRRVITASSIGVMSTTALLMTQTRLPWWCLALTLAQACVYLACSRDHPLGWTIGLGLQPAWATYSIITGQNAFLITTAMITIGNLVALRRLSRLPGIAALPRL
jgi:hypothetical protein